MRLSLRELSKDFERERREESHDEEAIAVLVVKLGDRQREREVWVLVFYHEIAVRNFGMKNRRSKRGKWRRTNMVITNQK